MQHLLLLMARYPWQASRLQGRAHAPPANRLRWYFKLAVFAEMKADRDEAVNRYENTLSELEAHVKVIAPQNRDDDVLKAYEVLGVAQFVFERVLRVLCKYAKAGEVANYARKYLRYGRKRRAAGI